MKELNGLTGLRFLAALYVFIFHIHLRLPLTFLPAPIVTIISMGALGVNLFFVLSGFILTYAHLKDYPLPAFPSVKYYLQFLLKRVARIYPAYLFGLITCLAVSSYLQDFPSPFLIIVALDATMLQSYFPSLSMQWYGGGAWSVSTEFFFYLLFPFLLPALMCLNKKALLPMLILAIIASSIPGLFFATHPNAFPFQVTYAFAPSRIFEFICGITLGLLVLRNNFRVSDTIALILLVIAALYLAKFGSRLSGYTVHNAMVLPAIIALICVNSGANQSRFFKWIGSNMMQYLGRISFSFYIMQLPILILLEGLLSKKVINKEDVFLTIPIFIVNIALAAVLYELIEKKAHRFLVTRFFKKPILSRSEVSN